MSSQHRNNFPKLHNAMWPGLVGKGSAGGEPCIDLDTMLELTANAEVDGVRFDGVDLFLFEPHISIESDDDGIKRLADKVSAKGFVIGSVVAPVWPPTGGGSAMGSDTDRQNFVGQVRKACHIARTLRELGVRPGGIVRIDSACSVTDWAQDPEGNQQKIAQTFAEACDVADEFGERLAAEGEICWGGMHSWKRMVDLLERVNRPGTLGFQADMAHTLLYILGYNAPEDALLPQDWDWSDPAKLDEALKTLTDALRPWTIDFHVAQNDGTVKGSGSHDKTGHHCLPKDPNGKLNIPHHAGFWLREQGESKTNIRHICWDGCMFPNETMHEPSTWNDILEAMIEVRDAYGWQEPATDAVSPVAETIAEVVSESETPAEPVSEIEVAMETATEVEPEVEAKAAHEPPKTAPVRRAPARAKSPLPSRTASPPSRAKADAKAKAKVKAKAKAKAKIKPKAKAPKTLARAVKISKPTHAKVKRPKKKAKAKQMAKKTAARKNKAHAPAKKAARPAIKKAAKKKQKR